MFEFFIAKKYLIPKKHQLSASLIAILSILVISLVVWLLLLFLSITEGMEKSWQKKLTSLNAPIKITPTTYYKSSYYHLIDTLSASSGFSEKSLSEKLCAERSDPYNEEEDYPIPSYFPKPDLNEFKQLKDPVKLAIRALETLKTKYPSLHVDDFEVSAAFLKLKLIRQSSFNEQSAEQSYLSQMCYLGSYSEEINPFHHLIEPVSKEDFNHLLFLASLSSQTSIQDTPDEINYSKNQIYQERISHLFQSVKKIDCETKPSVFKFNPHDIDEGLFLSATYNPEHHKIEILPHSSHSKEGLIKERGALFFIDKHKRKIALNDSVEIQTKEVLKGSLNLKNFFLQRRQLYVNFELSLQGKKIHGTAPWTSFSIKELIPLSDFQALPKNKVLWPYFVKNRAYLPSFEDKETPVILPKNFKESGVLIGDKGYLSYGLATASTMQEQRLPIFVAGFYDPGVLSIGNRYIMLNKKTLHQIASASKTFSLDENQNHGFHLFFEHLDATKKIKNEIEILFKQAGIEKYFKITPYYDFDFAKDLMHQFKSDKLLFTLIGSIILIVACSNIVSFLIIMINDKKKEIGILQSMGATRLSVVTIFSFCGGILGIIGSLIGAVAASVTMRYINELISLISYLQGQPLLQEAFYGSTLGTQISHSALAFILIAAPCLSIISGFIPAYKASRVNTSSALRSQ